jgi:hypothetical protein
LYVLRLSRRRGTAARAQTGSLKVSITIGVSAQLANCWICAQAIKFGHPDIEDDERSPHSRRKHHGFQPVVRQEHVLVNDVQIRWQTSWSLSLLAGLTADQAFSTSVRNASK